MKYLHPGQTTLAIPAVCVLILLSNAAAVAAQTPLACVGQAFVVQNVDAVLYQADYPPPVLTPLCEPAGIEYNNIGYRRQDGKIYALQLNAGGNLEILQIDGDCNVTGLGRPAGLPSGPRFDAGDVSTDGTTMFLSTVGHDLYRVSLTSLPSLPPVVVVPITGDGGNLHDWAFNPRDGKLYGGDNTDGQLARLDPVSGVRTDMALPGLPSGTAFGAAWFDAAGRLYLYQNDGTVYEVDVTVPEIVAAHGAQSSSRNDAASCIQDVVGLAKRMTTSTGSLLSTLTIELELDNLSSFETVSYLSAIDDLQAVFGTHGADWSFLSIVSDPADFANPAFDGHSDTELIRQSPSQSLSPGEAATVTVEVQVHTLANLDPEGRFCNQVVVLGRLADGGFVGDWSTDGLAPDPNGDGDPAEQQPSCVVDTSSGECGCEGKVTSLTLRYLGGSAAEVRVVGKFGSHTGDIFLDTVAAGATFVVEGPPGQPFRGTLGTDINLFVDGAFDAEIHTSCSQPIGPGQVAGSFEVVAGESKTGGALCPYPG